MLRSGTKTLWRQRVDFQAARQNVSVSRRTRLTWSPRPTSLRTSRGDETSTAQYGQVGGVTFIFARGEGFNRRVAAIITERASRGLKESSSRRPPTSMAKTFTSPSTINEVGHDKFKEDDGTERLKPILYFAEKVKPLILNKSNFTKIAEVAGGDTGGEKMAHGACRGAPRQQDREAEPVEL
jgi:hypothetical protein